MNSPSLPQSGFIRSLAPLLGGLLLSLGLSACSRSYCGAPCEPPRPEPAAKAPEQRDVLVNQYGSVYGYLEVDSMSAGRLKTERASLEILLSENPNDAVILKVLKAGRLDTATFVYDDYSTGGSRYTASGKLRRDAEVKDSARLLPRLISESRSRELIERYRQVRRRLLTLPDPPPAPPREAVDTLVAADSLWTGTYRAGGDTAVVAPEEFMDREACEAWGRERAEGFRSKAYGFEFECRGNGKRARTKVW